MSRIRPYIIQATYDWIVENRLTPYFLIDADFDGVEVPWEYVKNGQIVLNASPDAIENWQVTDEFIGFDASFSGKLWQIFFPIDAMISLYAKETGQGIYDQEESYSLLVHEGDDEDSLDPNHHSTPQVQNNSVQRKNKPGLHVVK